MSSMALHSTKDYGEFALYEDNRVITQRSIDKMVSTLTKKNLLSCFPIVVFRKARGIKYITDGQRRFLAAKHLGLPIYYIVNNQCTKEDIPYINTGQQGWKLDDFLHSYTVKANHSETGAFKDYLRLQEFIKTYSFSIANSICMLVGYENAIIIKNYKEGKFKVTDYHLGCKTAQNVTDVRPYHDQWRRKFFIRAMTKLTRNVNYVHENMMAKIRDKHEDLLRWSTTNGYVTNLQKIYNSGKHNKTIFIEE